MKLDADTWKQVAGLFDELADLEPKERDRAKRRMEIPEGILPWLDLMLEAHDAPDAILLDQALEEFGKQLVNSRIAAQDGPENDFTNLDFGPWRAVEEIGRGGMGVVLMGERADGQFEKTVAIKLLISERLQTSSGVSRKREIRLLAGLEHPNIAHLLDSGESKDGIPYLVMEYVEGVPITRYCRDRNLGVDKRIKLFIQAAEAVAFSHRRLVVHCDIKPGNVLVTEDAQVKLVDFGISYRLEDVSGERLRPPILRCSPAYAAPEQLAGQLPTVAQDVFALGALLYELVTGSCIRDGESATAVLFNRQPSKPVPKPSLVPGCLVRDDDLDAICMRALATDPSQRYRSADDLAADLDHWLNLRPVSARAGGAGYRLRKWLRRERWIAAAGTAAIAALLLSTGLALWQAQQARINERRATTEAAIASAVVDFLTGDILAAADPMTGFRSNLTVLDAVALASEHVDMRFVEQPEVAIAIHGVLGEVLRGLEDVYRAIHHFETQLALLERHGKGESLDAARVYAQLCHTRMWAGFTREATVDCSRAGELHARHGIVTDQANIFLGLARLYMGRFSEAVDLLDGIESSVRGSSNIDLLGHFLWYRGIGNLYLLRFDAADKDFAELVALHEANPDAGQLTVAWAKMEYGRALCVMGQLEKGVELLEEVIPVFDEATRPGQPNSLVARVNLAEAMLQIGHPDRAVELLEPALEPFFEAGVFTDQWSIRAVLRLAIARARLNQHEQALGLIAKVGELWDNDSSERPAVLAGLRLLVAQAYAESGLTDEAEVQIGLLNELHESGVEQIPSIRLQELMVRARIELLRGSIEDAGEILRICRRDAEALLPPGALFFREIERVESGLAGFNSTI